MVKCAVFYGLCGRLTADSINSLYVVALRLYNYVSIKSALK